VLDPRMNHIATQKLDRHHKLWVAAEEAFAQHGVLVSAWVQSADVHLGIFKMKGKWRLCTAPPLPPEQLTDDDWKPVTESAIKLRTLAVKLLPALMQEVERSNAEMLTKLDAESDKLASWLQTHEYGELDYR
jgi:hypothetical protein